VIALASYESVVVAKTRLFLLEMDGRRDRYRSR